jgi:hypothetical protein
MTLEHGRTRYTRGCRCDTCKAAERDYQRNRYRRQRGLPVDPPVRPKLRVVDSPPFSSNDGCVVGAVRAELEAATAASERLRLAAAALASLHDPKHVATQPAAARQLVAILNTLSKPVRSHGTRWLLSGPGRPAPQPHPIV